ncbi:hypothetical protein BKA70DRAFT_1297890 [Coprinopsis sp. MPI-PUGE-AT-0042]|nr:hypothetical protein BKA70DRAFT_1297890 [Coprinopsis sp. MPI-PUGE-AT-0042]
MIFTQLTILLFAAAALVSANPISETEGQTLVKRETSYGNPDLVTDQGDRFKLNFAAPTVTPTLALGTSSVVHIPRNGGQHGDVSLGDPDDFVDEGNRWRLNYGSTSGHPNACDGHFICYISK